MSFLALVGIVWAVLRPWQGFSSSRWQLPWPQFEEAGRCPSKEAEKYLSVWKTSSKAHDILPKEGSSKILTVCWNEHYIYDLVSTLPFCQTVYSFDKTFLSCRTLFVPIASASVLHLPAKLEVYHSEKYKKIKVRNYVSNQEMLEMLEENPTNGTWMDRSR